MKIKLLTGLGHFIIAGEIPDIDDWPKIVLWKDMTFIFDSEVMLHKDEAKMPEMMAIYKESFTYTLLRYQERSEEIANRWGSIDESTITRRNRKKVQALSSSKSRGD